MDEKISAAHASPSILNNEVAVIFLQSTASGSYLAIFSVTAILGKVDAGI
jgi:hypothetical protein